MLAPKRMSSIQRTILLVAAAAILILSVYLLYHRFFAPKSNDVAPGSQLPGNTFSNITTDFSYDFIKQHPFIDLQPSAALPITVTSGALGHSNPFVKPPFGLITH